MLTGEGSRVVQFGVQYPNVLLDIFLFSLVGALGQNFIYYTIYNFGALVCSIITTTRKFFTILFSVLFYGHTLTSWQWIAVVMVFVGLILDMLFSKNKQHHTKEKKMWILRSHSNTNSRLQQFKKELLTVCLSNKCFKTQRIVFLWFKVTLKLQFNPSMSFFRIASMCGEKTPNLFLHTNYHYILKWRQSLSQFVSYSLMSWSFGGGVKWSEMCSQISST